MDEEQTLVDAAKSGDSDAADTLIRRYQVRIFNFARTLTANDEDAEDLAQETFVRAFRGMPGFRGEASFKNWLYTIATNVARSDFGKRARQAPVWDRRLEADDVPEHQLRSPMKSVEDSVIHRQMVDRALATLSEELRVTLVLHDVEGLEYREIASVLDIPVGTVMSRIFRARRRLRPVLTELQAPHLGEVAL